MKCEYCQAEIDEGANLCPACGQPCIPEGSDAAQAVTAQHDALSVQAAQEQTAHTEETKSKGTSGRIAWLCAGAVAVIAVLVALILLGTGKLGFEKPTANDSVIGTVPEDGNRDDVTCQGSYTVSDSKAESKADKVIATMEGGELTNELLQIFYWMQVYNYESGYGAYGIDMTQPLDRQTCPLVDSGWTWQQYFLGLALQDWQMYNAFCLEARTTGFEYTEDISGRIEELRASLEASAADLGFASAKEMVCKDMGAGASVEAYLAYVELIQNGYEYYNHIYEQIVPTEDQIREYYQQNLSLFEENGITDDGSVFVDVRHILIQPEDKENEADWAAAETEAQALMDQWLAGEGTEESFAALANEHSADPGSNTNGGLYEFVETGRMVEEFDAWCFDPSRQTGDHGLVKTSHGYHIMYFVQSQPIWHVYAANSAKSQLANEAVEALLEKYPADVDYTKIVLGQVDLATGS